jgi:hypothetical protein
MNFRLPIFAVWGNILLLLLLLVMTGCSVPSGSDLKETPSDQTAQEAADDENGKNNQQTPGKNQEAEDDEDGEDGQQTPGENQADGEDGEDGQQTPGENQADGEDGEDNQQTPGENPADDEDGEDGQQTPGENPADGEDGEDGQQTPGENQADGEDGEDGQQTPGENPADLGDAEGGETGFLSWNINYPEETVWGAVLTVSLKIGEDTFIPYKYFDLTDAGAGSRKVSLPPGTYKVESRFLAHNAETGSTEILNVYSGKETKSSQVTIPGNVFPTPREFSSTGALQEYLNGCQENTADNPYPIKFTGADLSSKESLKTLYEALMQRYVTLDLRECTGTKLIAASTSQISNRKNIAALVLPDSVIEINSNGFSGYMSLKSAVMPKVQTINTSAFKDCPQLKTVFAPKLETVTEANANNTGAFAGCTALETLYCPSLVTLGKYAVYGCTALTEAAFPRLQTIGGLAFKRCTALKTLSLPSVTKIDGSVFEEDAALMYLIFGVNPPELETSIFKSTDFSQNGVIYVPKDSLDTYKNTSRSGWTSLKNLVTPLPDPAVL